MAGGSLWDFALEAYGRPGVEQALIELQDAHGQCVPFLLWRLWLSAEGRKPDAAVLGRGAALARAWDETAVAPLRGLRRQLKRGPAIVAPEPRERLREGVKALELMAERLLLERLESESPPPVGPPSEPAASLEGAIAAWGGAPPPALLRRLAALVT